MKKLAIVVVIVLLSAAGWAGATYYTGVKVEERYHGLLEEYGRWGPFSLSDRSYQRGFGSATAETVVALKVPVEPIDPDAGPAFETVELVFAHTIYHGPLPLGTPGDSVAPAAAFIDTRLVLPETEGGDLAATLREIPELRESIDHAVIGFDGSVAGQLEIPPFTRDKDGTSFTWGGLVVHVDYVPRGALTGTFELPKVELAMADGTLRWQGIHGHFNLVEALPMLFLGRSQTVLGGMTMQFVDQESGSVEAVEVQEFRMDSDSLLENGLVHGSYAMSGAGFTVDGATYGPLEFEFEMKNFDGRTLSDYQQRLMDIYRQADFYEPEQMIASIMPLYTDLVTGLLTTSPEINIRKFYLDTPQGAARGTLMFRYDNPGQKPPADLSLLPQLVPFIDASAELAVDQRLATSVLKDKVELQIEQAVAGGNLPEMSKLEMQAMVNQQIENQLGMFEMQGFILRDGETVRSDLVFSGGQLLVNGKPLQLGQ